MRGSGDVWYRQAWPWVLICIPFSAVLFGVFMIVMATVYPDDLVADDYYRDGMAINRHLDMDEKARAIGIRAVAPSLQGDEVSFTIEGARDSAVLLNLFHVTDSDRDASLVLYPVEGGTYRSSAPMPIPVDEEGVWYVELLGADDHWRVRERVTTPATSMEFVAK